MFKIKNLIVSLLFFVTSTQSFATVVVELPITIAISAGSSIIFGTLATTGLFTKSLEVTTNKAERYKIIIKNDAVEYVASGELSELFRVVLDEVKKSETNLSDDEIAIKIIKEEIVIKLVD